MPKKTFAHVVLFAVVGLLSSGAFGQVSSIRGPSETFEHARDRSLPPRWRSTQPSAYESAVALADLDTSTLPFQPKGDELFEIIRDARYLFTPALPTFARRSSWLYPQDGCWIRASLARRLSVDKGYGELKKLFIFGSLTVTTKNAPAGSVSWWYHVVPVYADELGQATVMDPAISPAGPMPLEEWARTMVPSADSATYSVCSPSTYDPSAPCEASDPDADRSASVDQQAYLDLEWDNLLQLHRDPTAELGDSPPWPTR